MFTPTRYSAIVSMSCFSTLLCASTARAQQPAAAPSSAVQPAQQAAGAQTSPAFPYRANEALPPWLRIRAEMRERVEGVSSLNFTDGRDDNYALTRFRFNAALVASPAFSFTVQAQDARVGNKEIGSVAAPFAGTMDLRMAYGDVGRTQGRFSARLGRQELVYGEQRLVGHVSWLNTARTFDGAKATFRSKPVQVDFFAASVVRIMDDEFDKSGNGNGFYGAYATAAKLVPQSSVEPYLFWRTDRALKTEVGSTGTLKQTTLGARWNGKLPKRLDYGVEMALQAGSLATDSVNAWGGHWQVRETYPGAAAVRVIGEFNLASGDSNPTDGRRETFDNLYPTPHDKYGLADQVGWKNIRHARAGVELIPFSKTTVTTNYHSWWVMERRDAVYNAGGAVLARVVGGATESHVGQELDVQAARPITAHLQLAGGFAHIFPGGFLKQATPGRSFNYGYVMATWVFLADK